MSMLILIDAINSYKLQQKDDVLHNDNVKFDSTISFWISEYY